ncbi:hypothetical protein FXO37_12009 [Capsicum annuum]|nr:hypothetical protein FXO37_12009 [Capsicum annuum]
MYLNPKLGGAGVGGSGLIFKDKYYYGFFNAALKLPAHFKFEVVVAFYNIGVHYDTRNLGVLSPVTLSSLNVGSRDLAKKRSYKVGLKGESLSLHTLSGSSSVDWVQGSLVAQKTTPDLVQEKRSTMNQNTGNLMRREISILGGLKVGSGSRSPQYKEAGLSTRWVSLLYIAYFFLGVFVVNRLLTVARPVRIVNDALSVEYVQNEGGDEESDEEIDLT